LGGGGRATKLSQPAVSSRGYSSIRLPDQPYARIGKARSDLACRISRPVVNHDQPPILMRLCQHRRNRPADPGGSVESRNDNTNTHAISMRAGGLMRD
jgi:hypothetical protein